MDLPAPRTRTLAFGVLLALGLLATGARSARAGEDGLFAPLDDVAVRRAATEGRILVLSLSTQWCHWCHVMDRETWADARVREALARRFLPVRADADARPDLAERLRNYRWPATAFFAPDGSAVLALRGHRSPAEFLGVLDRVVALVDSGGPFPGFDDPNAAAPPAEAGGRGDLEALRERLRRHLDDAWDEASAGWGRGQKYPFSEPVEVGLRGSARPGGRARDRDRALRTLEAMEGLIDPVWGGMYQYSLEGRWDRWHPEKIVRVNAGALRVYALAARMDGARRARWLADATNVERWMSRVLAAPGGGFFASQDADPPRRPGAAIAGEAYYRLAHEQRLRYGVPRVDRRIYARENGWAIEACCALHEATGADAPLALAVAAARRVLATHSSPDGSLRHAADDVGEGRHLGDQVAMARALVALHEATGEPGWLERAAALARVAHDRFALPGGGYADATAQAGAPAAFAEPVPALESSAEAARLFLSLAVFTGEPVWRERALRAIAAVADEVRLEGHGRQVGGLLLAVEEAVSPWVLVKVEGDAADPRARVLFDRARHLASTRPDLRRLRIVTGSAQPPRALVCTDRVCLEPVVDGEALDGAVARALGASLTAATSR